MIPFAAFETTPNGEIPYRLLDQHPDGKHLALQTGHGPESAVWEQETGHIVWMPADAIALSWLNNGTQIAVLREASASPYEFAIYTWPERLLLHRCPIVLPMGWPLDFRISPHNDLALCRWVDQSEAGFVYIDIAPQGISQDRQASYILEETNDITQPAFSPAGQLWVCGWQRYEMWWAPDPEDPDTYQQPARGGEYQLGALMVFRGKQQPPRMLPLIATIPAGWLPADPAADEVLSLADPIFLDADHVQIRLPSGEVQVHLIY